MAGSSFFYCGGTIFRRTVVDFKLYSNACHPPHFNDQREQRAIAHRTVTCNGACCCSFSTDETNRASHPLKRTNASNSFLVEQSNDIAILL